MRIGLGFNWNERINIDQSEEWKLLSSNILIEYGILEKNNEKFLIIRNFK